jgi:hypothetical protein
MSPAGLARATAGAPSPVLFCATRNIRATGLSGRFISQLLEPVMVLSRRIRHIALQSHSWGGYQSSFIVTQLRKGLDPTIVAPEKKDK